MGTELRFVIVAAILLGMLWGVSFWRVFSMVQSALYRLGAGQWSDLLSRGLSLAITLVLSNPPAVVGLCLVIWLIRLDHRYNPKEQRRSWVRSFLRILRDRQFRLPVQQRLRRWALTLPAAMAIGAAAAILLLVIGVNLYWWNVYFACALLAVLGFFLRLVLCILSARHQLALARDIGHLADQTAAIRSGNLDAPSALPEDGDLHQIAEDLSQIQSGLQQALSDRTRSERMKVELIANVSHDLKTPLTSILSYAELLRQEPLEGAAADYARIIDEKAQRLKAMVQDVFEISKAASDQLPVELERLDFAKLVRQTLADMADPIEKSGLTLRTDLPEGEVPVVADGKVLLKDGVVVDYIGALNIVRELKARLEERIGHELVNCAIAMPAGTESSLRTHQYVAEGAGFEVTAVLDEPSAANSVYQISDGAVVDIGGGTTGIAVLQGGKVVRTEDEPTGGTHMTLVLAGNYKVPFDDAEKIKQDYSRHSEILPVVKAVAEKMAGIVKRHVAGTGVQTLYLCGGTSCLTGIEGIFEKETGLRTIKPKDPFLVTPAGIAMNCKVQTE